LSLVYLMCKGHSPDYIYNHYYQKIKVDFTELLFFPNYPIERKTLACSSACSGIASFGGANKRRK